MTCFIKRKHMWGKSWGSGLEQVHREQKRKKGYIKVSWTIEYNSQPPGFIPQGLTSYRASHKIFLSLPLIYPAEIPDYPYSKFRASFSSVASQPQQSPMGLQRQVGWDFI